MGANQKGCEFGHGRVVGLGIGHIGVELNVRRILSIVSAVELSEGQEQTLLVRTKMSCFFIAMRTSMISWATSVTCYINVPGLHLWRYTLPAPPAITILTMFNGVPVLV
jgi:hypothetical protein